MFEIKDKTIEEVTEAVNNAVEGASLQRGEIAKQAEKVDSISAPGLGHSAEDKKPVFEHEMGSDSKVLAKDSKQISPKSAVKNVDGPNV